MLKIDNLIAGYGKMVALNNISIEVKEHQTCIVVGPNGAGKSTLLRTIAGLQKPMAGEIFFKNQRIDGMAPYDIARLGVSMSPEGSKLFPEFTVYENLQIGAYKKEARANWEDTVAEIYQLFPILEQRKNQMAGSLSGGERQMLSIARNLMSKPQLVLLDEPSSGLAPKIVTHIFDFINEIKTKGYTILLIEQNTRKALQLADYVYLLVAGELKFKGTPDEFRSNPDLERAFLGEESMKIL